MRHLYSTLLAMALGSAALAQSPVLIPTGQGESTSPASSPAEELADTTAPKVTRAKPGSVALLGGASLLVADASVTDFFSSGYSIGVSTFSHFSNDWFVRGDVTLGNYGLNDDDAAANLASTNGAGYRVVSSQSLQLAIATASIGYSPSSLGNLQPFASLGVGVIIPMQQGTAYLRNEATPEADSRTVTSEYRYSRLAGLGLAAHAGAAYQLLPWLAAMAEVGYFQELSNGSEVQISELSYPAGDQSVEAPVRRNDRVSEPGGLGALQLRVGLRFAPGSLY